MRRSLTKQQQQALLVLLAMAVVALGKLVFDKVPTAPLPNTDAAGPGSYLFCFWNVENLFDDVDDNRAGADKSYDPWFARDAEARQLKLDKLSEAILRLNDGRGPDILAVVEVEGVRAAELLQQALNQKLDNPELHYTHVLMKNLSAGRHIAPALLTRLPVVADKTRLLGRRLRILETHVNVNGHDLVILVSHWTSRVSDDTGEGREKYADQLYGAFRAMYESDRQVDLLICGDFNDPPDAPSVVENLYATGDLDAVRAGGADPRLYNLMAGKNPGEVGTHYYSKWFIFDQIVASPGLLNPQGWRCEPETVETAWHNLIRSGDRLQRPWRFGGEREKAPRGYSDHFPVTVRLTVEGA